MYQGYLDAVQAGPTLAKSMPPLVVLVKINVDGAVSIGAARIVFFV